VTTSEAEIRHPLLPLRDYQREAARAIVTSAGARDGRSFSVQIARQGGKNELSAQIELLLLATLGRRGDTNAVPVEPYSQPS